MGSVNSTLKKEWRLIAYIIGLLLLFVLLWVWRSVLLPFVLGFIFAYLLLPIIRWLEKRLTSKSKRPRFRNFMRIITIVIVYLLALAIVGLLIFYVINATGNAINDFQGDVTQLIPNGLDTIRNWVKSLPFLSSPSMQERIDSYFQQASDALPGVLINFLSSGVKIISTSANTIIGFIIMPIFMFFILKDWEKIRDRFYEGQAPWLRKHSRATFSILRNVVIRYMRGQLFLGLVVGGCAYIMLLIFGIPFALPLAIFSGLTELVPMIGPWIGGGLGVLVTLAVAPDKALWVGLGYVIIQLLENNILVPRIQGTQMEIHPAFVILLSVLGAYFAGILGFIIILPATMAIIKFYRYFRYAINNNDQDRAKTDLSDDYFSSGV